MIKVKKIKPLFNTIITTMDKYENDVYTSGGLIDTSRQKMGLKEYQTVVAVGDFIKNIQVGDLVSINPKRFAVPKHEKGTLKDGVVGDNMTMSYNFDIVVMDDKQYLLLQDRDIEFVISEYIEEADPTPSSIHIPDKSLIL